MNPEILKFNRIAGIKIGPSPLVGLIRNRWLTVSEENKSSVSFSFGLDTEVTGV
jgi:hypothetical protein